MLIFGTMGKRKVYPLDSEQALIYVYRYFHIFWILRLAYGGRFELASQTPQGLASRPISKIDAERIMGGRTPKKAFWDQWSLVLVIVVLLLIQGIIALAH